MIPKSSNPWKKSGPFPDPMEGRDCVSQKTIDEMHGKKKLFIERMCPKCHLSNFSIRPIQQFPIAKTEPAIIGVPECDCDGDFFVKLDARLKQIFILTLMGQAIQPQKVALFSRIFFAPINDSELNVLDLMYKCSPACKGVACNCVNNPSNIITIHSDFEMAFVEKMSPSPFPDACFTPDDMKKIICILFN